MVPEFVDRGWLVLRAIVGADEAVAVSTKILTMGGRQQNENNEYKYRGGKVPEIISGCLQKCVRVGVYN